jgi:hypothetical protein
MWPQETVDGCMKNYSENRKLFESVGITEEIARKIYSYQYTHMKLDVYWLWDTASVVLKNKGSVYLEIGAARGGSAYVVFKSCERAGFTPIIKCIDPFCGDYRKDFEEIAKEVPLEMIVSRSIDCHQNIENESVDLLLVDGWHESPEVNEDIDNYWPKLKPGGVMMLHDCDWYEGHYDVVKAVFKQLINKNIYSPAGSCYALVRKNFSGERLEDFGSVDFGTAH